MSPWDGNGYPVKRCCAKCRTPYNCGNARCACHDDPAFGSGTDSLGAQGDERGLDGRGAMFAPESGSYAPISNLPAEDDFEGRPPF